MYTRPVLCQIFRAALKKFFTTRLRDDIIDSVFKRHAGMAELADALDSGSSEGNFMQVQVLFPAPQSVSEETDFSF